ncbi:indolepyruvate oxidoreductase subunit beta [Methermicoccus shengliensis]|uniref:Indolepyruvate oxidoreductase subunit beta n=1 Tax=Methermicoccus shengliensis TaxID=660064 RepID=A0A832RXX6_9EURY|nr:indolepyruvate oxidoreductase subunit beta [Methermicoccus shengliensis]KUK04551.1 MAG: Putative indolepyruvate ferredoxin oxidoreductase subunit beta [Euryarchaeota archaeon 55_53]KUK30635.1 MAG: Putative indolepyruvate ferredoxin oxidoreductase subunit beta [Methanosarcinales archeaon 56_1174]MDI3488184.1 indolepyruvate ferredoxin oxidoreductase, beta subunit [Methanosarcinales archaeon]MDN5295459.1 indolepyruvate ferredoxin oxidoreductase, beta subunit [Methanosarcinales archaeon]HIH7022
MGELNILIAGVGGQGAILMSNVIGRAAILSGRHVLSSETHGMAQRGGSVVTHVRIDARSPLIPKGACDVLAGLEPLEALRAASYVGKHTHVVLNTHPLFPTSVLRGDGVYPDMDDVVSHFEKFCAHTFAFDATRVAASLGSTRATNSVMLGAMSHILTLEEDALVHALVESVPPRTAELNRKAFEHGKRALLSSR